MLKISSKYFLTPKKKDKILSDFYRSILNNEIDKELIPTLKKFNKFNDIVSRFCCIGHKNFERGYILFHVSEKLFKHVLFNCGHNLHIDIFDSNVFKFNSISYSDNARVTIRWNNEKEMKREVKYLICLLKEFYK